MLNLDTFEHHRCGTARPKFESAVYSKLPQKTLQDEVSDYPSTYYCPNVTEVENRRSRGDSPFPSSRCFWRFL